MEKVRDIEMRQKFKARVSWNCLILTTLALILVPGSISSSEIETLDKADKLKRTIEVEAQETILHYQAESFWSDDGWPRILEDREEFRSDLIRRFIDGVLRYGEGGEHVVSPDVRFNGERKSTTLRCDIDGAISKRGDRYQATFFWLLGPLGLDFIDDDFEKSEKGLYWQGLIGGAPTTIAIRLPTIDGLVYKAWHHPIGHCHAHVWWKLS